MSAATKDRLIRHLDETREQKRWLIGLIRSLGGQSTKERAQLPIQLSPPKYSSDALKALSNIAEQDLKTMETDAVIENAEVVGYNTLM